MRDRRMSDEVLDELSPAKIYELRNASLDEACCPVCTDTVIPDAEAVSVLVVRHPTPDRGRVLNILFAHPGCAPSSVSDSSQVIDTAAVLRRMHVVPMVFQDEEGGPAAAGLLMEPAVPPVMEADSGTNTYIRRFLGHGLPLMTTGDVEVHQLRSAPGWRAVVTEADDRGGAYITVVCDTLTPGQTTATVCEETGIRPGKLWLQTVADTGTVALYAGLLGLTRTPDRDTETVMGAIGQALMDGNLCGGLIEAVVLAT